MYFLCYLIILVLIILFFKSNNENFNIQINHKFNIDTFAEIGKEYEYADNNSADFNFGNNLQNIRNYKLYNYKFVDISYN
jgi:hypothetical protein